MVCIFCEHKDTNVINSRQHKSKPQVWRRRRCPRCETTFTTYENIASKELPPVVSKEGPSAFSMPRLAISIAKVLHKDPQSADNAWELSQTIQQKLLVNLPGVLTVETLIKTTYSTLRSYDAKAALAYGVKYEILTPKNMI